MPGRIIYVTESMHNTEAQGQQVHIPQGEYLLKITKIADCGEKFFEDTDKNPFMSVRAQIIDGPVKNRPYSELLTWSPTGQFRMGTFLAAFNVARLPVETAMDYPKFQRYAAGMTKVLADKMIGAYIADNDYQGKITSQAVEFYPAEHYEDRKGINAVAAAAPNGVASTAAGVPNPMGAFEQALGNLLPQAEGA